MIEEKDLAAETAAPTGDAEKDKRMKKLFVLFRFCCLLLLSRIDLRELLTDQAIFRCFRIGFKRRSTSSRRTNTVVSTERRRSTRRECPSRPPRLVLSLLLFLSPFPSLRILSSFTHVLDALQRRCANCGAVGHMKTNRKCPKWAEFNLAPQTVPTATGVAGLPLGGIGDFGAGLYVSLLLHICLFHSFDRLRLGKG
jgi:hypothetical protein